MTKPAILGGPPVRTKPFPLRVTMGPEEKRAVLEVMDSDVLSGFIGGPGAHFLGGAKVREFEACWARRFDVKHAISVNSCTTGLMTAVAAVGVRPGDEVICSPYTMSASATSALFYGGIPVFADVCEDSFCLDPRSVERLISERTKAIIVVHIFGRAAEMEEICAIARHRGVRVIEDAAQAPGATYCGRPVGGIGDLGVFSLNFHKHIHTGEGGVIVTNDDELAHRCQLVRNHGENLLDDEPAADISNLIGANYRLTELQAAIGVAQLARLDGYLEHRQALAQHLGRRLAALPGIVVGPSPAGDVHAYYVYPFRFDAEQAGLPRSAFVRAVVAELPSAAGFESTPLAEGYVRPLYLARIYQEAKAFGDRFPFTLRRKGTPRVREGPLPGCRAALRARAHALPADPRAAHGRGR